MSVAVLHSVAQHFGVLPSDLVGRSRFRYLVEARAIAVLIMRERYGMSHPQIGRRLGGREHSTVIHLARKAPALIAADAELEAFVDEHLTGPKLPPPLAPFEPRFKVWISPQITNPTTALKKRLEIVRELLAA